MSYKTVLVYLDESEPSQQRLDIALRIARQFDAQLEGLYVTLAPDTPALFPAPGAAAVYAEVLRQREQRRATLEQLFHG